MFILPALHHTFTDFTLTLQLFLTKVSCCEKKYTVTSTTNLLHPVNHFARQSFPDIGLVDTPVLGGTVRIIDEGDKMAGVDVSYRTLKVFYLLFKYRQFDLV